MSPGKSVLRFLDCELDRDARSLTRCEKALPLTGKTFDLLLYMVENANRPLLKKELLDAVWPDSFVEESNLTQTVFVLRKALGADGTRIIQTLTGRGYQFTAPVTLASLAEETRLEAPGGTSPTLMNQPVTTAGSAMRVIYEEESEEHVAFWRSPLSVALLCAAALLLAVASWLGWQRYEDRVGGPPVQVVLADLDGDTGDPDLNRTLNDLLRYELAQSPLVTVLPSSTVRSMMPQMMHKPDDRLTLDLARDLCERTASQTVLHGHVARLGETYVVTEEATNCVDGTTLGIAKQAARHGEDLPTAMDRIGKTLRHELGESRRTIARFNQPLASQQTASLEALKEFSQAAHLSQQGRFAEATELLKSAVTLDPNFAAAYFNLAAYSSDLLDSSSARVYLQKAYDLREFTNQPARFAIIATYQSDINGDLYESLRNYQTWSVIYPRSAPAWEGLAHVQSALGRFPEAVLASRRHLELLPGNATSYEGLATSQMQAGDPAGARKTCELALSRGFDVDMIHDALLMVGHLTRDQALIDQQERWGEAHADAIYLVSTEVLYAVQDGQFVRSELLTKRMNEAYRVLGTPAASVSARQASAWAYFELDEPEMGHRQLHLADVDSADVRQLLALADDGQADAASALLAKELAEHSQATLWRELFSPLLYAKLALLKHQPAEALQALSAVIQLNLDVLYLRGEAYSASGQLPQAEAAYRTLIAHVGIAPPTFELPVAERMLVQTLAAEGKQADARSAAASFHTLWVPSASDARFRHASPLR